MPNPVSANRPGPNAPEPLYYKGFGAGPALVILHGLFGSWDNWYPMARRLSASRRVWVIDQRNHGRSFHSERCDYDALAQDLRSFFDRRGIASADILGHSMGGKAALRFSARFPARVERLLVVDITHRAAGGFPVAAIDALARLNLSAITRLCLAEEQLQPAIPEPGLRRFLLKNLTRGADNRLRWKVHLEAIRRNLPIILGPVAVRKFPKPCLFLRGAQSDYISPADWPEIQGLFPQAQLRTIPGCGHWPHVENPAAFLQAVSEFLDRPPPA